MPTSNGWRTTFASIARATPSMVTSSCVGPTPPEVKTTSWSRLSVATSRAIRSTSSGITAIRRTSTPSARSSRHRYAALASVILPERISLPMRMIPAVFGMAPGRFYDARMRSSKGRRRAGQSERLGLDVGCVVRFRRGRQPGAGARGPEHLRRSPRSQGDARQRRADRGRDQGARPRGRLLQRQRRRSRQARRDRRAHAARAGGAGRDGRAARAPPLARVRHPQAVRRRPDEGRRQPGADGHDARRDGAQPRLLDPGGRRPRSHDARRARLRDDLVGRHARPALLRPGLGGQGRARVARPSARLRAGAAGHHRQRDPCGRHRHPGPAEDPGPRIDRGRGEEPQPERADDYYRGRRACPGRPLPPGHVLDHGQRDRRRRRRRHRRVTYTQGVVLGIVQGVTEFLPISSSGHLILVPYVLGWPDQGLAIDAVMHLGTLAALLVYFRRELLGIVTGDVSRRLGVLLVAATVPGAVAGVLFGKVIEGGLRSPVVIAVSTGAWAIVMWIADRRAAAAPNAPGDPVERVTWGQGLAVGCAQALALVPGTSR